MKRIISLLASILLIIITVAMFCYEPLLDSFDRYLTIEGTHPGYWDYLHYNSINVDNNNDGNIDVVVFPISKMTISEITKDDYDYFLKSLHLYNYATDKFIDFLDGTGIDISNLEYGVLDTTKYQIVDNQMRFETFNEDKAFQSLKSIGNDYLTSESQQTDLTKIKDVHTYFDYLKKNKCSFVISVRDDAATSIGVSLRRRLNEIGLVRKIHFRDSYIAVVENGNVKFENSGQNILSYSGECDGLLAYVESAGGNWESYSKIIVDDIDYSKNLRGMNIIVINNGNIIDAVNFDTWSPYLTCSR